MPDIIIIGAGPAGMTAALYGLRAGKSVLLLEKELYGGQITYAPLVENYPGLQQISGSELAENMLRQITDLGAEIELETVTAIKTSGSNKVVITEDNEYFCQAVIIAAGVLPRHLELPGETGLLGRGVSYCAVCDGAFYRNKAVAVVGGGNSALQEAAFLANICREVNVIHRRDNFRGEERQVAQLRQKANVRLFVNSRVVELLGQERLTGIRLFNKITEKEEVLPVAGLFIAVGKMPANQPFAAVVELDADGYIISDDKCTVATAGIFAAGDCRQKQVRQLTTAAADGAVAAVNACNYIDELSADI